MISPFGIDHGDISKGLVPAIQGGPLHSMKTGKAMVQNGYKRGQGGHPMRHGIKQRVGQIRMGDPRIDDKTKIVAYRNRLGKGEAAIVLPRQIG